MAVTRVTNTRNGAAALDYIFTPQKGDKNGERVLAASGHNIDPDFALEQMAATWKAHGKDDGGTVQAYRIIQSFSLDELDPEKPEDIATANEIGYALANDLYPERQAVIVTQADGEGGKLHNHIVLNSVQFITGKSIRGSEASWETVAEKSDEILRRHNIEPLEFKAVSDDRKTMGEVKGEYVWKDDLKERIAATVTDINVTTREQFIERLEQDGIQASYRGKKDPKLSYAFTDDNGKQRRSRALKLGGYYEVPAIDERLADNAKRLEAEQARAAAAIAEKEQAEKDAQAFIDAELERQSEATEPVTTDAFDFDILGELTKIDASRQSARRVRRQERPAPIVEPVFEESPVYPIDELHKEALQLNEQFDEKRAADEAAALKAKLEKERAEAEAKAKAEHERKAAELAEQKKAEDEKARRQAEWFEYFDERYDKATIVKDKDKTDEHVRRFGLELQDIKRTGRQMRTVTGYEPYTDYDVIRRVKRIMHDEKREQRLGTQQELHQEHDLER